MQITHKGFIMIQWTFVGRFLVHRNKCGFSIWIVGEYYHHPRRHRQQMWSPCPSTKTRHHVNRTQSLWSVQSSTHWINVVTAHGMCVCVCVCALVCAHVCVCVCVCVFVILDDFIEHNDTHTHTHVVLMSPPLKADSSTTRLWWQAMTHFASKGQGSYLFMSFVCKCYLQGYY